MGAYIEYAKGGTDYRTKSTISCWVKRSELGREQYIWGWGENNSSDSYCRFDAADNIEMHCDGADGTFNTTRVFRDTNAWLHIVFSLDGSNATANLRRRLWINGVQVDEGKGGISAFSAAVQGWHSTQDLWIGANPRQQQSSGHQYFNGLISHFHYCSNNSYAASDFGEIDASTGIWKIKTSPSVNYGSEGFFLKMEDSSNLDLDSSSNNKTLTTSGTLTATKDCPSNVFATFNPLHNYHEGGTYAYGNTQITTGGSNKYTWNNSSFGMEAGKYYAEFKWVSGGTDILFGLTDKYTSSSTGELGNYDKQYAYRTNGTVRNNNGDLSGWSGSSWTTGDVIGVLLDMDNHKLYFSKNGVIQNSSTGISISTSPNDGCYYFSSCGYDDASCVLQANFGNGVFGTTALTGTTYNGADGNGIFKYDPNNITLDGASKSFKSLSTKGLNA